MTDHQFRNCFDWRDWTAVLIIFLVIVIVQIVIILFHSNLFCEEFFYMYYILLYDGIQALRQDATVRASCVPFLRKLCAYELGASQRRIRSPIEGGYIDPSALRLVGKTVWYNEEANMNMISLRVRNR